MRARDYELHPKKRILTDEIINRQDVVGALTMDQRFRSVASGVLAGIVWAIRHPKQGVCLPEDLPHREILEVAQPYLGPITSSRSDWTPLSLHRVYFEERADTQVDKSDPWQFRNFLFRP